MYILNISFYFSLQIITPISRRFSFRQLDLFNPDRKTPRRRKKKKSGKSKNKNLMPKPKRVRRRTTIEDLDSDDEFSQVNVTKMPKWNPPLSER